MSILFLNDNVDEKYEQLSNSKSSSSGCSLAFAWIFANFSLEMLIKVLLVKNVYLLNELDKVLSNIFQGSKKAKTLVHNFWQLLISVFLNWNNVRLFWHIWEGFCVNKAFSSYSIDTGRKFNVLKTFRRRPEHLLNVLYTLSLRPVSKGYREVLYHCHDYLLYLPSEFKYNLKIYMQV